MEKNNTKEEDSNTVKKTTKKTTRKTATKTASKKDVKLTFRPLFSASRHYTARLAKRVKKVDGNEEYLTEVPLIEGLPIMLTVKAGEVITVTQDQYEQLKALNFIEADDQLARRQELEGSISDQHPAKLSYDAMDTNKENSVSFRDLNKIYDDKLIVVG